MQEDSTYDLPAIGKPPEPPKLRKIALEEHFNFVATPEHSNSNTALQDLVRKMDYNQAWFEAVSRRLVEFGEQRLSGMDASGIDVSILSMTVPGIQGIVDRAEAITRAREINDFLGTQIAKHPHRFAGFASLPLHDPVEAAKELERCMTRLNFKGAMVNGY